MDDPAAVRPCDRLCWFCRHFYLQQAEGDWSEVTPGSDWSMSCNLGHWSFNEYEDGQAEFAAALSFAKDCPDFELAPEIVEKVASLEPASKPTRGVYRSRNWRVKEPAEQ